MNSPRVRTSRAPRQERAGRQLRASQVYTRRVDLRTQQTGKPDRWKAQSRWSCSVGGELGGGREMSGTPDPPRSI